MTGLGLGQVVGTLADMDMLDLDHDGSWPGEPGQEAVLDVAWGEVDSRFGQPSDVSASSSAVGWDRVTDRLAELASRRFPTPPEDVLDADAWYLPIHFFGPASAIYIREAAVMSTAGAILGRLPEQYWRDPETIFGVVRSALAVLYLHEAFHHKTESLAIRLEVVERERRYLPYHVGVYRQLRERQSDDLLEEALACAEMRRRYVTEDVYKRSVPPMVRDETVAMLPEWFSKLPPGYRVGSDYFPDRAFGAAESTLASQMQEAREVPRRQATEWSLAPHLYQGLFNCRTITHVLVPMGTEPCIPWFTREPVALPSVSSREAVDLLTRRGYSVVPGGKGSHIKLKCAGRATQTVPANRESLSPVVLRCMASALGLHVRDLTA